MGQVADINELVTISDQTAMTPDSLPACAVSEMLLEETRLALLAGDFDAFARHFLFPQVIETFEGRHRLNSRAELRAVFEAVCAQNRVIGLTDMVRTCIAAEFKDPDTIEATHVARLLSGTRLLQEPHTVFSILRRVGGTWKIASSQYAMREASPLRRALMAG